MRSLKVKKFKLQLSVVVFLLFILFVSGFFVLAPVSWKQAALALSTNYNKNSVSPPPDNQLSVIEWNNLPNDFLAKTGDTPMEGDLNMGAHRITNLNTIAASGPNDAANVNYVDTAITNAGLAGGGDIFINWGRNNCPAGSDILYGGHGFSAPYDNSAGGSNPVCIQGGDAGPGHSDTYADKMLPIVTGGNSNLPNSSVDPASTISGDRVVKCAVCHSPGGTCYIQYGSHNCGGAGFNMAYDGYILGSFSTNGMDSHWNSTQRACVNRSFDAGDSAGGSMGAMWYGARIQDNFGLGYTQDAFIKCAVCCN